MRIQNLEELRKIHEEIKNRTDRKKEEMVLIAMAKMMELHHLARREGLLALEEAVEDISLESDKEFLKSLIMLLVDGTDPVVIAGIGWSRYYVNLYTDYEALRHLIYLEGVLSIQAGDNPHVLEEKLKGMLSPNLYLRFSLEKEPARKKEEQKRGERLIENLCKGERLWSTSENGYYVSKLLDYVICDMTDKELQRVMRETENTTLTLAMKGMSGLARKRIFDNLSMRLAKMVAEDMTNMGPVRILDIVEASQKMLSIIIRLVEMGELIETYEYLMPFYNVFSVDTKSQQQKNAKINQLKKLVEEYEQAEDLVKEYHEETE